MNHRCAVKEDTTILKFIFAYKIEFVSRFVFHCLNIHGEWLASRRQCTKVHVTYILHKLEISKLVCIL